MKIFFLKTLKAVPAGRQGCNLNNRGCKPTVEISVKYSPASPSRSYGGAREWAEH